MYDGEPGMGLINDSGRGFSFGSSHQPCTMMAIMPLDPLEIPGHNTS